ncbi:MAG TPA: hypothetical protein VF614_13380 [Chthoniobacteraceae bacterium]
MNTRNEAARTTGKRRTGQKGESHHGNQTALALPDALLVRYFGAAEIDHI